MKPYFSYGLNVPASHRDLITSTIKYENETKRYFSSTDAEMYIAGKRILDLTRIDFSYQENKMPMYGFNSFVPSRVFVGQKIIQGTFAIAYTEPGYIAKLISNADDSVRSDEYDKVGRSCDKNNAALFKKAVDITVGYGGYNNNENSYRANCYTIQGVYITGFQQILDTSGEPVYEAYSFLAKDISFDGVNKIYEKSAKEEKEKEEERKQDYQDKLREEQNKKTEANKQEQQVTASNKYNRDSKDVLLFITRQTAHGDVGLLQYKYSNHEAFLKVHGFEVTISNNKANISKSFKFKEDEESYTKVILKEDIDKLKKAMPNQDDSIECTLTTGM